MTARSSSNLNWLLDELVDRLPGVHQATLLSTDGLLVARSSSMSKDEAEHFSALSSALYGLARSAGSRFGGGGVLQAVVELEEAVMFVTAGGANTCLAVWAADSANMGLVAFETNQTIQRVGTYLSAAARTDRVSPQV
ncbi:roadblock/LC7 domain-containing protein [Nocardia sp. NPDC005366]|uniref:roadblock/LC7 domain-containing protein n=1 Tax=Nocardia sp. NPDC005366 TaxID=3156878 RepID=UPI0033B33F7E